MNEQKQIEKALGSFLEDYVEFLARILGQAVKKDRISYEEIERLIEPEDDIGEVLLLGYDWRILLPVRSSKSMEWENRLLIPVAGEIYELPNGVKCLVREAARSGTWKPEKAVAETAREMGEPAWDQIPELVKKLGEYAEANRITGFQIKKACKTLRLEEKVDSLIAGLKGSGILSPSLGYLPEAAQQKAPVYELNPALFPGCEGCHEDSAASKRRAADDCK
jgi:hypothetical protein